MLLNFTTAGIRAGDPGPLQGTEGPGGVIPGNKDGGGLGTVSSQGCPGMWSSRASGGGEVFWGPEGQPLSGFLFVAGLREFLLGTQVPGPPFLPVCWISSFLSWGICQRPPESVHTASPDTAKHLLQTQHLWLPGCAGFITRASVPQGLVTCGLCSP